MHRGSSSRGIVRRTRPAALGGACRHQCLLRDTIGEQMRPPGSSIRLRCTDAQDDGESAAGKGHSHPGQGRIRKYTGNQLNSFFFSWCLSDSVHLFFTQDCKLRTFLLILFQQYSNKNSFQIFPRCSGIYSMYITFSHNSKRRKFHLVPKCFLFQKRRFNAF